MGVGSKFIFATCQVGAEKALKAEAQVQGLQPAFMRPGFVTLKADGDLAPDFELKSVFARAYGLCFGRTANLGDIATFAGERRPREVHVFERDRFAPGEEPKDFVPGRWAVSVQESAALREIPRVSDSAEILDVICVEGNEWWYGLHAPTASHSPIAGGVWDISQPADAPSRAYVKLEEMIRFAKIPIQAGDQAVEIGSAPGGASFALLQRGVSVVGVDPGEMDSRLQRFGNKAFKHIAKPVADVLREELPKSVEWLLVDMNVEPRIALAAADRLGTRMKDGLLGMILTLKLNRWDFAKEIPYWLEHVNAMGVTRQGGSPAENPMARVRAAQLYSHRREIGVVALTRKGAARLGAGKM